MYAVRWAIIVTRCMMHTDTVQLCSIMCDNVPVTLMYPAHL
jgi:hypothetical protein